ncbi:cbb3-type cytochrome oxidase subunit 3 [Pseudomonas sp. N040]|uniref:cbb3-type cytochrome oxidase subunit 3 n=1 Tax=Pseudomonas sp. N040 TaxID=2785325 RepID=UPI0018A2F2D2|nr:cbb3-type cytochrome c oxidase subunit 3 [Pseudomonas sp. N040]MBF7729015.1 cbb3-type cytochrome c oxidase subunit 3 [Pseudomonas sp. N040]MBW7012655.1 cbb3-type cytochrome c oxidase subunit 3 [Pseudomonas sp. N040]
MDIGTLRGLGTLLVLVAFVSVTLWAYSGRNKARFDEAANLPFADEAAHGQHVEQFSRSNNQ